MSLAAPYLTIISIMKNKTKNFFISIVSVLFWLVVWEIASRVVDLEFVLPTVGATFKALINILATKELYLCILTSLLRIICGFILGFVLAILLFLPCIRFPVFKNLLSPVITVSKSTPVATIIIILWIMVGGPKVPIVVSMIMTMPIIWQNLLDGYSAIDPQLEEVCNIFRFGFYKRLKLLIFPTIFKFLLPSVITASGLAWKAGIAAEIICITRDSLGKEIYNAKSLLDGPKMFAYTLVVVLLSWLIERIISFMLGRISEKWHL